MVIRFTCAINRHQQKMKLLLTLIFCWAIILVSGADQIPTKPIEKNASEIDVPIEPTNPNNVTSTTLLPPQPETTTITTTSTTKTTTTTTTTITTPKTTTPDSNTTTSIPTTTPTPTPAPPTPKPEIGQWTVNSTNYTCIVLRMAAQFNITYITSDNKTMSRHMILPSSNVTTASGNCGDPEQVIEISWNSSTSPMKNNDSLIFHFIKNKTQSMYSLHHIEVKIAVEELPKFNSSSPLVLIHNASEYKIPLINSYRCLKSQKISLSSTVKNTTGILDVSDLQFQAFKNEKSSAFSTAEDCPYETPDYVPIAVGCGLIILVVVVLVAYLVGRRRSQARGYLSM
ncbi:lysosome-associated membrane glycoprotein 1-like [Chelonus insularis]|uniref:lysosome-associated membrane glycoprotein 1-like n=1 Tax=Chelonus insularis TaxID=460826 RepID=UPI00158E6F61|nr:lysosome-associated membrane glycoprotein 1-like [Chelonus insularis]